MDAKWKVNAFSFKTIKRLCTFLLSRSQMLVDIKIELSNIVRENNKLANEMESLRNTETVSRN